MLVELKERMAAALFIDIALAVVMGSVAPELCQEWFELYPDVPLVNATVQLSVQTM